MMRGLKALRWVEFQADCRSSAVVATSEGSLLLLRAMFLFLKNTFLSAIRSAWISNKAGPGEGVKSCLRESERERERVEHVYSLWVCVWVCVCCLGGIRGLLKCSRLNLTSLPFLPALYLQIKKKITKEKNQ